MRSLRYIQFVVGIIASLTLGIGLTQAHVEFSSPANGATVGRSFTLVGETAANCGLGIYVDQFDDANLTFYINPDQRSQYRTNPGTGVGDNGRSDADGRFSLPVDVSGNEAVLPKSNNAAATFRALPAGRHQFQVRTGLGCEEDAAETITLNVTDGAPAGSVQQPTPVTATASPTATPAANSDVAATAVTKDGRKIPAWVVLTFGALLGVAALALAEASALKYQQRHGKRAGKR